jgi:hypothetical protein
VVGWVSAFTIGLAGSLVGLATRGDANPVASAAKAGAVLPGMLGFQGLFVTFAAPHPALWLAGLLVFFLPGPIAAASTAWLFMRETHGTS